MRWLITTVAFLVMLGPVAMAQNNNAKSSSNPPAMTREAPIGHRQPRADQFPSEKSLSDPNSPENREDAALDRKIKSICRGC